MTDGSSIYDSAQIHPLKCIKHFFYAFLYGTSHWTWKNLLLLIAIKCFLYKMLCAFMRNEDILKLIKTRKNCNSFRLYGCTFCALHAFPFKYTKKILETNRNKIILTDVNKKMFYWLQYNWKDGDFFMAVEWIWCFYGWEGRGILKWMFIVDILNFFQLSNSIL